jgi:predicted Zn-dependent protease
VKQRRKHGHSKKAQAQPKKRPVRRVIWLAPLAVAVVVALYVARPERPAEVQTGGDVRSGSADRGGKLDTPALPGASGTSWRRAVVPDTTSAAGLVREARELADLLQQRFPDEPGGMFAWARLQYQLGNSAAAVTTWQACIDRDPEHAQAYTGMAMVAGDLGNYDEASSLYRKAMTLDPASTRTRVNLASALLKKGEAAEAITLLDELDPLDPAAAMGFLFFMIPRPPRSKPS